MANRSYSVRIFLLGRFEVARGERILGETAWSRRKAAALLQRLALEGRLLKEQAIEFLWPEANPASGANNLYRTLHALRQTLDTALGPGAAEATFVFQDGVLALVDSVWVDVAEFELLARSDEPSALAAALDLYGGDLLPDERYAEWTLIPRETLHRRHRDARLALAARTRDAARAIDLLTPLLAQDPADEVVHRELMRLYALSGRRHEALRQYQACTEALAGELDVPPAPETEELYSKILNGELVPPPAPVPPRWVPPTPVSVEVEHGPPLIGRQAELDSLRRWVGAARSGRPQTLFLAGDPGVGKTRLASEFLQLVASEGMTVLLGAAYEQEGQLPYQPFIEAFDHYLAEHRRSLEENPITYFRRSGVSDPQQEHWALFKAAAAFLTGLATRTPVVLLVDDLHAADEASLQLFHYLARQTRAAPVFLLATYRSEAAASVTTPFATLLNSLYREHLSETLALGRLAEDAVARMLAHTLGGEVEGTLIAAVYSITEGNPFFVQEIATALLKDGQVEKAGERWRLKAGTNLHMPAGLSGLLRERVRRLGPPVESTLTAAAVIGREFGFDVLRGVATLPDGPLLDALDAALTGRLLEETAGGYRFRHALIRHALYNALSRGRRAWLHGQTAEAIESVYTRRPGGLNPHVEALAFHYDLSDRRDRALTYLIRAGRNAARLYAFEVAVNSYERALALLDTLSPDASTKRRFRLLESLGKYYKVLADTPKSVAAFERALEVSGEDWQPQPAERARIRRLAAVGLLTAGRLDEAAQHLEKALAELEGSGNSGLEFANVLYNVAQLHWHRNEYREAFEVAQRSLAVAEWLNDPPAIARAFEMLALACHSLGEWQTGMRYEQKRAALAGPGLDVTDAFDVHL